MMMYQGTKRSSRFQVKDQTKFEHTNDTVYCWKNPENDYHGFYIGEADSQISERIIDHKREIKIKILYNMLKITNTHMFG